MILILRYSVMYMQHHKNLLTRLSFFVFIFFTLFLMVGVSLKSVSRAYAFDLWGMVLGDDDENDDEDEDKDDDKDEDEDEDKEDSEDDEDSKDEDEKDDEDEKEHVEQTRTNANGVRTVIKKESEGDKMQYEIVKYDASGKKIEERKYESTPNDETQFNLKTFGSAGGKLSEIKYKSKDGEEIKLMIRDEDKTKTFVRYDENHNSIKVIQNPSEQRKTESETEVEDENETETEDEIEIDFDQDSEEVEITRNGKSARVTLPVSVNDDTGGVVLSTSQGDVVLAQLPDMVVEQAMEDHENTRFKKIRIREQDDKKLVYELTAEKAEKLLGLFAVQVPSLVEYDAQTGELVNSSQTFMQQVLDILSF